MCAPAAQAVAHRVHDVAQVVSLVGVDPADEHQHPVVADPQRQHLAAVPLGAVGGVKPGSSAIGTTAAGVAQCRGRGRPAGSEDHGDVVRVDAGAFADGCRGLRRLPRLWVGHGGQLKASVGPHHGQ